MLSDTLRQTCSRLTVEIAEVSAMDVPHEQPALSSSKSNRFTSQRQTTGVGTTTVERLEPRLSPASRHITEAKAFGTECHVSSFTREQDPDRAVRVEQIHGEAYVAAGHVYESALDELGRLDNSNAEFILDKARGSTRETEVIYLHAVPAEPLSGSQGEGGLRIVGISAVGSIDDLSAFKAAKPSMGLAHQRKLYDAIEDLGHGGVKEIAALSVTADALPRCRIRSSGRFCACTTEPAKIDNHICHASIRQDGDEFWSICDASSGRTVLCA